MQTRREFTRALGLGALGLGLAPAIGYGRQTPAPFPPLKDPKYRTWSEDALREAKTLGCTYADIRFTLNRSNGIAVRNGRLTTSGNIGFGQFGDEDTYGFGVRVIHSGVWGFSSSPIVTPEEITRIVGDRHRGRQGERPVEEVRRPAGAGQGATTPSGRRRSTRDPWTVPLEEKIALLVRHDGARCRRTRTCMFANAAVELQLRVEVPGHDAKGRSSSRCFYYTACSMSATARQGRHRQDPRPTTRAPRRAAGSSCSENDLPGNAERVAAEAVEHAMAKPVGTGLKDLLLMPSHSALTIHEIIAHPTELDRIVGYEANYAGTSFVTLKDLGKLKYGSKLLNITADRTHPGGMSTVGFDDDGVEAQKWPIVRDGILVGLQTNRETAHYMGETSSRGCTFANHWRNYPFLRMPNIQMEAGPDGIADRRSDDRATSRTASWSTGRAASASTSSATTDSSAAMRSGRSRTARRRAW